MYLYWHDLGWDCYLSFFAHQYQSYGPWFMPKFCFRSISWERIDRISQNFIYALILTRSRFGLLSVIFGTFVPELWPLIYSKILFPLNILRTSWQNFTKLYICIYIDKIYVEIATFHILLICNRVMALDWCQNFVSSQYLWDFTFLQHEKHCSGAIIRFSDNSSSHWLSRIISLLSILAKCTRNCKLLRRIHARVSNRFQHLGSSIQNAADNATHRCTLIAFGPISPIIKRLVPWLGQINGRSHTECHLLITFANSLDPDQAWQNVRFDLDPICLTLRIQSVWHSDGIPDSDGTPERILRKNWFKKNHQTTKKHEKFPRRQRV